MTTYISAQCSCTKRKNKIFRYPHCPDHGDKSQWYNSASQKKRRAQINKKLIPLQRRMQTIAQELALVQGDLKSKQSHLDIVENYNDK